MEVENKIRSHEDVGFEIDGDADENHRAWGARHLQEMKGPDDYSTNTTTYS